MYIFFCHPFAFSVLSEHFDPKAPFNSVSFFMAHLIFPPPQLSPASAMETDNFKASSSFVSNTSSEGG